jgi:hypothetical protein
VFRLEGKSKHSFEKIGEQREEELRGRHRMKRECAGFSLPLRRIDSLHIEDFSSL